MFGFYIKSHFTTPPPTHTIWVQKASIADSDFYCRGGVYSYYTKKDE